MVKGRGHAAIYDNALRFLPVRAGEEDTIVRGELSGEE